MKVRAENLGERVERSLDLTGARRSRWRLWGDRLAIAFGLVCTAMVLLPLVAVAGYAMYRGWASWRWSAFVQLPPAAGASGGGIGNAIVGTVVMVAMATAFSAPLALLAGLGAVEFGSAIAARWLGLAANVLAGVPSILAGIFAYGTIVRPMKTYSAVAGSVALAIVMVPTIAIATLTALQSVAPSLRQGAAALGARPTQSALRVVLPAALPAIFTGVMLAIARAIGETAPLLFAALFSFYWPRGIAQPAPSLAVLIYNFATSPFAAQQDLAWMAVTVLIGMVTVANLVVASVSRRN
ncbi:MAG: phosphate ABC transporter permease PstA [Cyanobacteria bacterium J06648_11]